MTWRTHFLRFMVAVAVVMFATPSPTRAADSADVSMLSSVQAQRATSSVPPGDAGAWEAVTLPDAWYARWPDWNGDVWYRLTWEQTDSTQPAGLLMEYLIMAGEVYVNGQLMHRDTRLSEPLTRAWNTPRQWLVSAPLLREGTNTVLIRAVGKGLDQAGLGPVMVGDPQAIQTAYERAKLMRHDLQVMSASVLGTIVCFFAVLWLMRPRETIYGWFALCESTWLLVIMNQLVSSPWPLPSNDAWQALNAAALFAYAVTFAVFIWRFEGQKRPRLERVLLAMLLGACAWLVLVPGENLYVTRSILMSASALIVWGVSLAFLVSGWRRQGVEHRILAICVSTFIVSGVHDLLNFLQVINTNIYYTGLTANVLMLGMALVLAWRFVESLRRIESFNLELQLKVATAKAELSEILHHKHEQELEKSRINERYAITRDLHDGLGGVVVSSISAIEHQPNTLTPSHVLQVLKDIRDELRLVVDTSAAHHAGAQGLHELLAPLRHRYAVLLESSGIQCHWQLNAIEHVQMAPSAALDVMRVLQEALTNVIKHSRARKVVVAFARTPEELELSIRDDGAWLQESALASTAPGAGNGLGSMRERATRLGAQLCIQAGQHGTEVLLRVPLRA